MKESERKIVLRRDALLDRAAIATMAQDNAGMREVGKEILEFSKKYPSYGITGNSVSASINRRRQNMAQSVNGVTLNKRLRAQLMAAHSEEPEEEVDTEEE